MDKFDFITRIIKLYPHAVKDYDAQYDTYNRSLSADLKVDYDKVFDIYCTEYSDSFPPPPGLINEWAMRCIKKDYNAASKWVHVRIYDPRYNCVVNNDCAPADWSEEKILKWYKKRFNCDGWRIVELRNA